jgi:GR25 family glycosyltransferase involved in LPS biosynthesis
MKIGIFLINLDDRKDRLDSSTKQLNEVGLQFIRVSAVPSKDVEESIFLTDPVLACWKSHLKTYSILVESDLEYALILEDDFLIKNQKKFSRFLESLETERHDLLQIGFLLPGLFNRLRWIFEELEKLIFYSLGFVSRIIGLGSLSRRLRIAEARSTSVRYTKSSFLPGTHAYLINKRMALALVSLDSPQFSADEFFIALSKMRSFRMARFWRSLVTQSNSAPSINERFVIRGEK